LPLPYSFLLGVLALLTYGFVDDRLPEPVSAQSLFPWMLLLPGPWILARVMQNAIRSGRVSPYLGGVLVTLSVPVVYLLLLMPGQLSYLAHEWSVRSHLLEIVILVAPLLLMEFSVSHAIRRRSRLDGTELRVRYHTPLVLLILVPLLLFAAGMDVLFQSREMMLFFSWTSLGSQLGLFIFVGLLCVLLPLLFLLLMPVASDVPADLRGTASSLGFPARALYSMNTGGTLINAALVGPLRWPRFLVLTDGLLAHLDPLSLQGVVAHEVGHAKAGHPTLLMVLFVAVPILCLPALEFLPTKEMTPEILLLLGGVILIAAITALRRVAHRFEFEADQLSAEALGGASPCIRALERVGQIPAAGSPHRSSLRHPSDARRIENLLLCEADPQHRMRFHARGRALRGLVWVGLLLAVGLSIWAQLRNWPADHINLLIYSGRFNEAALALDRMPAELDPRQARVISELREELAAGQELFPHGGEWEEIRDGLGKRALERGKQILVKDGAAAARPWLALALSSSDPAPQDVALYLYCRAMAKHGEEEAAEAARLRKHLLDRLRIGGELGRAIALGQ